ncbi:MAG TPA: BON domain-containing protein [Pirellulales bacterium]|nr:BON domain-containing protein [Pirellulales bacterium]
MVLRRNATRTECDCPADSTPDRVETSTLQTAAGLLRHSPYLPLRGIRCELRDGVLTLRGQVPTYFLKQLAQTMAMTVPGIDHVANRIDVVTLSARSTHPETL